MNILLRKIIFLICCISCGPGQVSAQSNDYIRLGANEQGNGPGMFSCVVTMIGLADLCEKGEYPGFIVDYQDEGAYYEPERGLNWWTYYYEPICVGKKVKKYHQANTEERNKFSKHAEFTLSQKRCSQLIKKYIQIKPAVQKVVDDYVEKNFNSYVIGIHYRGTDKMAVCPRADYEVMSSKVIELCNKQELMNPTIFVATDEQDFLAHMQETFPGQVIFQDCIRSENGKPVHLAKENKYKKGEEALVDCLLLSKCQYLIRTSSNLSLCSTFFNETLPVIEVTKKYEKYGRRDDKKSCF